MIAAFSAADQLRRRPAPVNTSIRRTGSGICLCSEIDMCRSPRVGFEHHSSARTPKGAAQTPLTVDSDDVNNYLREITGEDITAKDFRTWAATHLAAQALREFENFDSDAKRKKAIVDAVKKVASHLGNTPAICRRSYIHPAVLDGYMDGTLLEGLANETQRYLEENIHGMKPEEAAVTAFLRLRLSELA